jgi:hypothetical protein
MNFILKLVVVMLFIAQNVMAQGFSPTSVPNTLPNDPTTGTILNRLAKITLAGTLVVAGPTDTGVKLYVVIAGAGTTGSAAYVESGDTICEMDSATTNKAGTYIVVSPTGGGVTGRCHQQDSPPGNGFVNGTLLATTTVVGGTARISAGNIPFVPGTGGGTVTSVGLAMPTEYTVAGTPVSAGSGVLTVTKAVQGANLLYAGPTTGASAAPTFRGIVAADLTGAGVATGPPAGDLGGASYAAPLVLQASTSFRVSGIQAISGISGDLHNYSPTNWTAKTIFLLDGGTTDHRITGLAANANGDLKILCNAGATNTFVLGNQDAGSTTTNRLQMGSDVTLRPGACKALWSDTTAQRWKLFDGTTIDSEKAVRLGMLVGDPSTSSPALNNGNDTPDFFSNDTGQPVKVTEISCKAPVAGVTVDIAQAGTATSILSGVCTCGVSPNWGSCSVLTTAVVKSYTGTTCPSAPCGLDALTIDVGTNNPRYYSLKGKGVLQ